MIIHSKVQDIMILKTCEQCGRVFEVFAYRKDSSRFCSHKCKGKWMSKNQSGENNPKWKGGKGVKICAQCGTEFEVYPSVADKRTCCSHECYDKWRSENVRGENHPLWKDNVVKICEQCGEEFEIPQDEDGRRRCCSRECHYKWRSENIRGENSPVWKGGLSFEPYCSKFNEKFKESIRDKFNRTCFLCQTTEQEIMELMRSQGKRAYRLSIHHVNYNKDCLCDDSQCEFVPLCIHCHAKTSNGDREYWENLIMEKLDVAYDKSNDDYNKD